MLTRNNPGDRHGRTSHLTPAEVDDLVELVARVLGMEGGVGTRYEVDAGPAMKVASVDLRVVGDGGDDPRFRDNTARLEHGEELDTLIAAWVAQHTLVEALRAFEEAEAAAAPVYRMADVFADPHYQARRTVIRVDDDERPSARLRRNFPHPNPPYADISEGRKPLLTRKRASISARFLGSQGSGYHGLRHRSS